MATKLARDYFNEVSYAAQEFVVSVEAFFIFYHVGKFHRVNLTALHPNLPLTQGTFFKTMKEAKPTTMFGVPRVWEKVKEKLEAKLESSNIFKKGVIAWAQDLGQVASIDAGQGSVDDSLVFHRLFDSVACLVLGTK